MTDNKTTTVFNGDIQTVQTEAREWRAAAYPDTANIELQALGVCEEAGELAHAVLKFKQGIRGYDKEKTAEEVSDAIGDIFIYACGVADHLGINVVLAIEAAWRHVKNRNITQGSDPGREAKIQEFMENDMQDAEAAGMSNFLTPEEFRARAEQSVDNPIVSPEELHKRVQRLEQSVEAGPELVVTEREIVTRDKTYPTTTALDGEHLYPTDGHRF